MNYHDYVAVLAYLPDTPAYTAALERLVATLERELGAVTTFQRGPRYLHSTGQLHKGGPNTGVFIVLGGCELDTDDVDTRTDLRIPGAPYSLRELFAAQRVGDTASLVAAGRRVFVAESIAEIDEALATAAAKVERGEL